MGFRRDLGLYFKKLVTHDWTTAGLFVASLVVLVLGFWRHYVSPIWGISSTGLVLLMSGFRLWRAERGIEAEEATQLREIANRLRDEIDAQETRPYRMFSFAENPQDKAHHEKMFRKHLPKTVAVMDAWLCNPDARSVERTRMNENLLAQIPEGIPGSMRQSVANSICSYVETALSFSVAPPGKFDVELMDLNGNKNRYLRFEDSPGQHGTFPAVLQDIDQIAVELNELSVSAWQSTEGQVWRELARLDWRNREKLRDRLTTATTSHHWTRKYCDQECYESPS